MKGEKRMYSELTKMEELTEEEVQNIIKHIGEVCFIV